MTKPTKEDLKRANAWLLETDGWASQWPDGEIAQLIADVREEAFFCGIEAGSRQCGSEEDDENTYLLDKANERIEALEAKCALLEASLKQADARRSELVRELREWWSPGKAPESLDLILRKAEEP